jgi:hypothetical protein
LGAVVVVVGGVACVAGGVACVDAPVCVEGVGAGDCVEAAELLVEGVGVCGAGVGCRPYAMPFINTTVIRIEKL